MPRRTKAVGRVLYDDPRFEHPSEDEYADVVPIPFFPADLPRLGRDPFLWTPQELSLAMAHAHAKLFKRKHSHDCRSTPTSLDQH